LSSTQNLESQKRYKSWLKAPEELIVLNMMKKELKKYSNQRKMGRTNLLKYS
tara:strand:- start:207 stop:362 length:156 start_codon:yes stop_codon:yes gene_type:complete